MLRVTIELLPGGSETGKRHLGTIEIVNDGTGSGTSANYGVTLSKWGRPWAYWREGRVEGFPRVALGPYDLLLRALSVTVGRRNPPLERDSATLDHEGL